MKRKNNKNYMLLKKSGILSKVLLTMLSSLLILSGCGNKNTTEIRVGALKGPTTIGLLRLMEEAESGESLNDYTFEMAVAADELTAKMIKGDLDIALIPANVASVLYQKTQGGIRVIDINTLGVLYLVSGNDQIKSVADLKGQTIYLTGKGTTPDYALQYLLTQNGISVEDVTLEYRSEATEVATLLTQNPESVGLLPQPFATVACVQNESLKPVVSLTEEWDKVQGDGKSSLVTGVTVVRTAFLEDNEEAVKTFLAEHSESCTYTETNLEETAALCVKQEIIAKEPIAMKAIPNCNIVCITGDEMKQALSGYLQVLFNMNPQTVGEKLPEDDFYYLGN